MNKNNKINVEVRLKKPANNKEELIAEIKKAMSEIDEYNITNGKDYWQPPLREYLCEKVDRIICYFTGEQNEKPIQCKPEDWELANYFLYTTTNYGPMAEEINTGNDVGGGDDAAIGSYQWELPTIEFEDLWQSLVYDNKCPKEEMLKFIKTTMKMVNANVNPAIITQNRLILLKGPPGTGKTTLCKAVAQKIAIRMPFAKYKKVHFVEVNSHSLFSKWFSESGKLIQKLFTRIQELAEREDWLIFVLIDEIESLTMGREASISGNDPTDSVRAVNAVLTQLDKTKRFKNVFILCTSNIEKALDTAFIDRVGLVRHIGHPGEEAIFTILMESIRELINTGLLRGSADEGEIMQDKCRQIAKNIGGRMSGRTLRNLPLEIFSECDDGLDNLHSPTVELAKYLDCLEQKTKTFQNDGPSLDKAMSNLSILH